MSETPTGRVVLDALLKLKALGFIESTEEQIGITDAGRRFLDELPVNPASLRAPYAVFLRTHVTPSLAKHTARLKRLCQHYLARAYALTTARFPKEWPSSTDYRICIETRSADRVASNNSYVEAREHLEHNC